MDTPPFGTRVAPIVVAVMTWPLLFLGGLVTTYRAGMAVPDWPTTFGINMFLYDFLNSPWAVYIEHVHRLYASCVGLATILLAVYFSLATRSRVLAAMSWIAVLFVVMQGLLGGLRVLRNSTLLATIHGTTGQAYFAFLVLLCLVASAASRPSTALVQRDPAAIRRSTILLLGFVSLQLILGGWVRHFGSSTALAVHFSSALLIVALSALVLCQTLSNWTTLPFLRRASVGLLSTLLVQSLLGVSAWWMLRPFDGIPKSVTPLQAIIRTAHQANAALMIASVLTLAFLSHQRLSSALPKAVLSGGTGRKVELLT